MKKVAFIITALTTGGAENMLLKVLERIDRTRFDPVVISLRDKGQIGPKIEALGIAVYSMGMRPALPNPLAFVSLVSLIKKLRPDAVHTWMYHADLFGGLAARIAGVRAVGWSIHHSDISLRHNKLTTLLVVKLCAFLSGSVPSLILSCSEVARQVHVAAGYSKRKIRVIPNGFDLSLFMPDVLARASVRDELNIPLEAPMIGLIARWNQQKNHLGFIQAAALVNSSLPSVHFILAGTDVDSSNSTLTNAIKSSGLEGRIHLLGRRDDVPRLMASLDVLASSSFGEAFPNILGEAMACGVLCAVTAAGDSAEIVADTGRVVAIGDMQGLAEAMIELLKMPSVSKKEAIQTARERVVEHYEISQVARQYEAFIEDL